MGLLFDKILIQNKNHESEQNPQNLKYDANKYEKGKGTNTNRVRFIMLRQLYFQTNMDGSCKQI